MRSKGERNGFATVPVISTARRGNRDFARAMHHHHEERENMTYVPKMK